jgi:SAM-dependent methyltransferase
MLAGVSDGEMRRYWDARADEDAYYFVDNRLEYGNPDERRFWEDGPAVVDAVLDAAEARIRPEDRIVEIGCGIGRLTRARAERAASVVAVDVSERMLAKARESNPGLDNVVWRLGDGESLRGIGDASADACFSHVVFQHIPDPEITLGYVREIGRVLRPGGWAAFQVSNSPSIHAKPSVGSRLIDAARALAGRGPRGSANPAWRGSWVELDALRRAAAQADATVAHVSGEGTQFCIVRLEKSV